MSLIGLDIADAQQTTFIGEPQTTKRPLDVEVTPNGLVAVIRGHAPTTTGADGLVFVDTTTGLKLTLQGSCHVNTGQGGYFYSSNDYQPSDSLRVTNSRAILIGARDTNNDGAHDRTYIDVVGIDTTASTPTVACLAHYEQGSTTSTSLQAGWTNDVEITPDESFAIVNSSNWIHVIDMATGALAAAFNIGSLPYAGPCFAGDSVDSIATTNSTAIVTTTRVGLVAPPWTFMRTWVYMIDLEASPSPTIALEHELMGPLPTTELDYWPHDVTVTPNGSYAIVTANNAVGVYDMVNNAFLARDGTFAPQGGVSTRSRNFSDIVDSVETTNTRFVTLANDDVFCSPTSFSKLWIVEVYQLPPQPDAQMEIAPLPGGSYRLRSFTTGGDCTPTYLPPDGSPSVTLFADIPHDLAVDSDKNVAVVRTKLHNLILTDLVSPDAQDLVRDWSSGVANNEPGSTTIAATNTFVSDSVLIAQPFIQQVLPPAGPEIHHYALTLGSEWTYVASTQKYWPKKAKVDVIDLNLTPPSRVHTFEVVDSSSFPFIYPADLRLGPVGREFVVRCNAQPNFEPGTAGGRDFVRFDLPSLTEVTRLGGSGRVWAVDGIEVGRGRATSVGEDKVSSTGFVHVVGIQ